MSIPKSYNEISSTSFNDRNDSGKISSIGILPTFSSILLWYFFRFSSLHTYLKVVNS